MKSLYIRNCAVRKFFSHNAYNLKELYLNLKNVDNLLHFRIPLNAGNSCVLLFDALFEESRYMKSVVTISLARYRNSRYMGVYCTMHFI